MSEAEAIHPLVDLYNGDVMGVLRQLSDNSVQCCVTSPPYWGLRDYGVSGQLGLEQTPEEYIAKMVAAFRDVRRILRDDGTLWLNMGDCYSGNGEGGGGNKKGNEHGQHDALVGKRPKPFGLLKPKDLCGVPWRLAFALQADGWYLRSDIIWHKPNPMPESVTDRPTKAHEYIFLLTKSPRYFYDAEAIREPSKLSVSAEEYAKKLVETGEAWYPRPTGNKNDTSPTKHGKKFHSIAPPGGRNGRSVWTIPSSAYPESHFATFPPEIPRRCILAGTSENGCCPKCRAPWVRATERLREHGLSPSAFPKSDGVESTARLHRRVKAARDAGEPHDNPFGGRKTIAWRPGCDCYEEAGAHGNYENANIVPCVVLDPFAGSGTTGQVARLLGRRAILIELNEKYCGLIRRRVNAPLDGKRRREPAAKEMLF